MTRFIPNRSARFQKMLGVIGHVPHWLRADSEPVAYEPYVREMRIWASLFKTLLVCSPFISGLPRGNVVDYGRANVRWKPVRYPLTLGWPNKLGRILRLPALTLAVYRTIRASDFVLLRSPGHFSLIGSALVRALRRRSITKWAGENGAYEGELLTIRLERALQSRVSLCNPILVYGPERLPHQVSFIPALMTAAELTEARTASRAKTWKMPWEILAVGRLVPEKSFDLALAGLAELNRLKPDLEWRFTLIGEGRARADLAALSERLGIAGRVAFLGALDFGQVRHYYARSHVAIMPGTKEGWPKIIAEAWAHGAIPVAASGGLVPELISDYKRGVVFEATPGALAAGLERLLSQPDNMEALSKGLFQYAEELSLDRFQSRLERVLVERCCLDSMAGD